MSFKSKACVVALAGALLAGLPATAFAEGDNPDEVVPDNSGTVISKTWVASSDTLLNATEVFTFNVAFNADKSSSVGTYGMPTASDVTGLSSTVSTSAGFDWTEKTAAVITFNNIFSGVTFAKPGNYAFTVSEVAGGNPNIAYDSTSYVVIVQIVKGENNSNVVNGFRVETSTGSKADDNVAAFANTAAANGALQVRKVVSGNAANPADGGFVVKITLTGTISGSYPLQISGSEATTIDVSSMTLNNDGSHSFTVTLGANGTATISNLPEGVTYVVEETNLGGYTSSAVTYNDSTKTIGGQNDTVTVTNTKNASLDTGIMMDIAPYAVVIGIVVVAGAAYIVSRKRRANDQF